MERIEATVGFREIRDDGSVKYFGGTTDNGECYKDMEAWKSGKGVIYIGEYTLIDIANGGLENGSRKAEELWTRDKWLDWVRYEIGCDHPALAGNDKLVIAIAEDVLNNADWQDLSTLYNEFDFNGDYVEEMAKISEGVETPEPVITLIEAWWRHCGYFDREQASGIARQEGVNYLDVTDSWWEGLSDDRKKEVYEEFFDENI